MFGVQPFEFLAARCTNLDEFFRSLELAFVCIEFGSSGDESSFHFGKFRAEDLRQRLTAPNTLAQFDQHARDASARNRRDDDLPVGVRLHDTRQPEPSGCPSRADGCHDDSGALNRFRSQRHRCLRRRGIRGRRLRRPR